MGIFVFQNAPNGDTVTGSDENDFIALTGVEAADSTKILGSGSNDTLSIQSAYSIAGADYDNANLSIGRVEGGDGNDIISVQNGAYFVDGGDGNDRITAIDGYSMVLAGAGADTIEMTMAASFYDNVQDIQNSAVANGGAGNDRIVFSNLNGRIDGESGNDLVVYETSPSLSLYESMVSSTIVLGEGDDEAQLQFFNGYVSGGAGDDRIVVNARPFGDEEVGLVQELAPITSRSDIYSGEGDDLVQVALFHGSIWTGEGNDRVIFSRVVSETLIDGFSVSVLLEDGDDELRAHGVFSVDAGTGNDQLYIEDDASGIIDGGAGDDVVSFARGNSGVAIDERQSAFATVTGGEGADSFVLSGLDSYLVVTDFDVLGVDHDIITGAGGESLQDLLNNEVATVDFATIEQVGDDVVITKRSEFVEQAQSETSRANDFINQIVLQDTHVEELRDWHFGFGEIPVESDFLSDLTRILSVDLGDFELLDVNGDGQLDVLSTDGLYGAGTVWFDGADLSVNRIQYAAPENVAYGDINGDGVLDVVSGGNSGLSYFDGVTGAQTMLFDGYVDAFELADVNGDGAQDVVASLSVAGAAVGSAAYFEGNGDVHHITSNHLGDFYLGDFDGDGGVEILSSGGFFAGGVGISGFVTYELSGSLSRFSYLESDDVLVADVNNDGTDELIANGAGAFTGGLILHADGSLERLTHNDLGEFDFGDVNGDGISEVVSYNGAYQSGVAINGFVSYEVGTGAITRHSYEQVDEFVLADFNGDGNDELLVSGGRFGNGLVELDGVLI